MTINELKKSEKFEQRIRVLNEIVLRERQNIIYSEMLIELAVEELKFYGEQIK